MIEIKIAIDEVDYEGALETLYPVLAEYLSEKTENSLLAGILSRTKGFPVKAVKAGLKTLPQDTKDELAVLCLNHYKEKIVDSLVNILGKHGILLKVLDMEMECGKEPDDRYFSG